MGYLFGTSIDELMAFWIGPPLVVQAEDLPINIGCPRSRIRADVDVFVAVKALFFNRPQ